MPSNHQTMVKCIKSALHCWRLASSLRGTHVLQVFTLLKTHPPSVIAAVNSGYWRKAHKNKRTIILMLPFCRRNLQKINLRAKNEETTGFECGNHFGLYNRVAVHVHVQSKHIVLLTACGTVSELITLWLHITDKCEQHDETLITLLLVKFLSTSFTFNISWNKLLDFLHILRILYILTRYNKDKYIFCVQFSCQVC